MKIERSVWSYRSALDLFFRKSFWDMIESKCDREDVSKVKRRLREVLLSEEFDSVNLDGIIVGLFELTVEFIDALRDVADLEPE